MTTETFYCWTIVLQCLTVLIAGLGLWGLYHYVRQTTLIAQATKRQGDILSRPTITVICKGGATQFQPYSEIATRITNHNDNHAKIRITMEARLHNTATNQVQVFQAPNPYDGSVWPFPAKQWFEGHFRFTGLTSAILNSNDRLILFGTIESCAWWGHDDFRADPPIFFEWNKKRKEWIPCPPKLQ